MRASRFEKSARRRERLNEVAERGVMRLIEAGAPHDEIVKALRAGYESGGDVLAAELLRRTRRLTRHYGRVRRRFERRLRKHYGRALDLFYATHVAALEAGEEFNTRLGAADEDPGHRLNALVRLHARSCLVASETHALLRTGHAHGAMARARTLHEHAVVAIVLGKATDADAERYLLHEVWEAYARALDYQALAVPVGHEPFTDAELAEMGAEKDKLVQRFGAAFARDHGWAAPLFPPPKRPTFRDLEKLAGLEHLRPWYRWFSDSVHAGSAAAASVLSQRGPDWIYVVGPSDDGLADPAHIALSAHVQVTTALLTAPDPPDAEDAIILRALLEMADKSDYAFFAADEALQKSKRHFGNAKSQAGETGSRGLCVESGLERRRPRAAGSPPSASSD